MKPTRLDWTQLFPLRLTSMERFHLLDDDGTEVTCDYVRDSTLEDDCTYTYVCDNGEESSGDC